MKAAAKNRARLLVGADRRFKRHSLWQKQGEAAGIKERRDARERPVVMLSRKEQRVDMRAGCDFDPLFEPDSVNKMQIALGGYRRGKDTWLVFSARGLNNSGGSFPSAHSSRARSRLGNTVGVAPCGRSIARSLVGARVAALPLKALASFKCAHAKVDEEFHLPPFPCNLARRGNL